MYITNKEQNKYVAVSDDAVVQITGPHYMVHRGESYVYSKSVALDNNQTLILAIERPEEPDAAKRKISHILPLIFSERECKVEFLEDPTYSGGSLVSGVNRNRFFRDKVHTDVLKEGVTITDDGTKINEINLGAGRTVPGESRSVNEWCLDSNHNFIIRITSLENSNNINLVYEWYEELVSKI